MPEQKGSKMSIIVDWLIWIFFILVVFYSSIFWPAFFSQRSHKKKYAQRAEELDLEYFQLKEMISPLVDLYKGRATEKNLRPVKEEINSTGTKLEELKQQIADIPTNKLMKDSRIIIKALGEDIEAFEKSCVSLKEKIKKLIAMEHENESVLAELQVKGNQLMKRLEALSGSYQLAEVQKGLSAQLLLIEAIDEKQLSDLINVHDTLMPIRTQMDEIENLLDSLPLCSGSEQDQPGEDIEDQVEAVRAQMEQAMLASGLKKKEKPRDEKDEAQTSSADISESVSSSSGSIDLDEVKRLMDQGLVFDAIHRMAASLDPIVKTRQDVQVKVVVNSPYPEQQESKKQKRGKKSG
ncbi:hypothetical protein [Paenibacillus chitinolyticus]|uniref:hypothetical protein n=1 Tax=Paenibacillus chitinolyticus TaxID=79263 RepID=UPI003CFEE966